MKKILLILAVLVAFSANAQQLSKKEFSDLKKKAEAGDFVSRCEYAYDLFAGIGCKADEKKGMEMLHQLMEQYPDSGYVSYNIGFANLIGSEPDTTMAIVYLNRGADQGITSCMNVLGKSYLFGHFTDVDYARAHSYFDRSVALDSPNGNFWMGYMIYYGLGCDFSKTVAMPFLQKAYSMKVPNAARMLGDIYSKGDPSMQVEMDRAKAAECYLNGVKWGAPSLYQELAQLYREAGDTAQADRYYRKAFESGEIEACYDAEGMYYKGENWSKCLEWSQLGDKAGSKNCSRVLGALYEYGYGVKPDAAKAAHYYEKDTTYWSYSHLGNLYVEGKLCKKMDQQHFDKGIEYLNLASQKGDLYATLALAETYLNGCEFAESDAAKSAYYYNILAEDNYPEGLFRMGQFYETGNGVERDTVKALAYMRQAAEMQHPLALCYLGDYYRSGQMVGRKDQQQSMNYYKAAADQGSVAGYYLVGRTYLEQGDTLSALPFLKTAANNHVHQAADRLGDLYNYGSVEIIPNGDSALHYYIMAAQQNNPHSCYVIGRQLLHEENYEMAVKYLSNAGSQGNDSAMVLLGECIAQGIGVKKAEPAIAYSLFHEASTYQNAEAYYMMGLYNLNGIVGQPEEALGKSYLDTAAMLGNVDAMLQLVYCYEGGRGCDYDHASAISWLRRAASLDNPRAIVTLSSIYAEGDDLVAKDEQKAFQLAKYAVDTLHYMAANVQLGRCYAEGVGCFLNSQKALECYQKAADAGIADAMFQMALFYDESLDPDDEEGVSIENDPALSFEWLQKASDAGHVVSMYFLGSIYESGNSVVKADQKLAKKYYKMAADQGMPAASAALNRMK